MTIVFRSLVLASVALFVLPPGWCCFVALGNAGAGACALGRSCCRPGKRVLSSAHFLTGTAYPRNLVLFPPMPIAAVQTEWLPSPITITFDQDATVVCWLALSTPLGNECSRQVVRQERQPVPLALHILHCVWLC